jgi:hypothetical protein
MTTPMPETMPATSLLEPGEDLLWSGRPDQRRYALRQGVLKTVVALFLVIFALAWMYGASQAGGYTWMIGWLFFALGLWLFTEPFRRYREARATRYILTSRRALILAGNQKVATPVASFQNLECMNVSGGLGDVLFIETVIDTGDEGRYISRDGFIGIADAEKVEREMRRLQAAA